MKRPCKRITEMRFLSSTVTYKFSNLTVNIEIMNIINYSSHPPIQKWYLLLWFLQFLVQLIPIRHVYCHFVLQKNELPSVKLKISQYVNKKQHLKKPWSTLITKIGWEILPLKWLFLWPSFASFRQNFVLLLQARSGHVQCFK